MAVSRRAVLGLVSGLVVAAAGALWWASARPLAFAVRAMSVAQMKAEGALVVDVRTPEEWRETGVIDGAKLVTFQDVGSFLAAIQGDLKPGQDLVLICHSGRRSAAAAAQLAGRISNPIISAEGGMAAVIAAGYQTVPPKM